MTINSSIPLDIVFQQCYDLTYLDPGKNKEACLSCFQGIYAAQDQSILLSDLAGAIFGAWGNLMDADTFRNAITYFKNADGSQAFDNYDISVLVSKYYLKENVIHFNHPDSVSSVPTNYQFVEVGNAGADGVLTKIVASTDLTDQGWGGTWGSDWRIFLSRDNVTVAEALYAVGNQDHHNPQYLRHVEHIFEPPARVLSTDKVILGTAKWYPGHAATIVNTSFDLFISAIENLTQLSAPQNLTFRYDTGSGFKIGWSTVKGNYGYSIQIIDLQNRALVVATTTAQVNSISVNIPLSNAFQSSVGYVAQVKAIGVVEKLNSGYSESGQHVSLIPVVTGIIATYDKDKMEFVFAWNAVENDDGYELWIAEKMPNNRTVLKLPVEKDNVSIAIPISKFNGYNHNSLFHVCLRAKQNGNLPAPWSVTIIPQPRILAKMDWRTPGDNLLTFESGTGLYWLSWKVAVTLTRGQMEDQLRVGQPYSGFQYASAEQVKSFLTAAGVDIRYLGPMMGGASVVDAAIELLGPNNYDPRYRSNKSAQAYLSSSDVAYVSVAWTTHPPSAWIMFQSKDPLTGHALVCAIKPEML